jgi:hypothetical protein
MQAMTTTQAASRQITEEVLSWPGVEAGPGSRGEFAFRVGRREIGHLHGDHAAHFSFPKQVWDDLYAQGRITYHPVFPEKRGPGARRIEDADDVRDVIALMRLNYDRATRPRSPSADARATSGPAARSGTPRRGATTPGG